MTQLYPRYEFTLSDDIGSGTFQLEPVEVAGPDREEADVRLRCRCTSVCEPCRARATQEDMLCNGCRDTSTTCTVLRIEGVVAMSHGQMSPWPASWT